MKESLKAATLYFLFVFGAGFVLGAIRTLWLAPRVGVRAAELLETPFMVGISVVAAKWVIRRTGVSAQWTRRLATGLIALGLMLSAEFSVVLWIRGETLRRYFELRDPVSGTVYFLALGVFALIPLVIERQRP